MASAPSNNVASSDVRYLPVRVVMRIFSVDRRTVIKWVGAEQFPNAILIPGCGYRIPESDVKALQQALQRQRISLHPTT